MESLYTDFLHAAASHPKEVAISHLRPAGPEEITYRELKARVEAFTHLLCDKPSPFTLIFTSKSIDSLTMMLASLALERPFSFLNRKFKPPQLEAIINATRATYIIVDDGTHTVISRELEKGWGDSVTWYRLASQATDGILKPVRAGRTGQTDQTQRRAAAGIAACLFTSGSTGKPKGVLIGRDDLRKRVWAEIELFKLTSTDVLLSILPVSFDVGLNQVLTGFAAAARIVIADSWLPIDIMRAVSRCGVTGISAVPSIWRDMLVAGAGFENGEEYRALRYITISGGDLSEDQLLQIPSLAPGVDVYKTYGQTESFRSTALLPNQFATKYRSVGRRFADASVYVVNEQGNACAPHEHGEIVHAGLGVMEGYLGGGDESKLRKAPSGLHCMHKNAIFTGDTGYFDEDGFLYLVGRSDDMLKITSNRVYPSEILSVILEHESVADAYVVGVDVDGGEKHPCAFLVPRPGKSLDSKELKSFLVKRLPSYMIPRWFFTLSALPRTESGKPDGHVLRVMGTEIVASRK